nr:multiheme c-type cytochrome [Marinicella sp. W31]MDC2877541.1 multiheme c-type cytochrome [Marinicella sp. W31]
MKKFLALCLVLFCPAPSFGQETPSYIGSQACSDCHDYEYRSWRGSDHERAWTAADPENVRADFDGSSFEGVGMSVDFSHDSEGYHALVTESDGSTTLRDVHSVVGIEPLQQYLFETEPGRLQSFDVVWDTEKKEWFHLYPDPPLPPDDGMHWTGPYKNWNARCAECHATGFEKRFDAVAGAYHSTEAEIGVGCEACHGPGSAHASWMETHSKEEAATDPGYGLTMETEAGTERWIQQCAGCHSRREAYGDGNPLPGTPYHDAYRLTPLTPGLYYPDGQIRGEVYVYGSFLQSKMYEQGVGCLDCHDPHTTRLIAEGNALCAQCHSPAGNVEFPTLVLKEYDTPDHHHHEPDTAGAECKNCHMLEQVYMGNDWRADHSFRIPRPDLSGITGAPDACSACHTDETASWAATAIAEWYPDPNSRGVHYGATFAMTLSDPAQSKERLVEIANDEETADIVRATALALLRPSQDAQAARDTAALLTHDSPLLRAHAAGIQQAAPSADATRSLEPLLTAQPRTVRFAALRQFFGLPTDDLTEQSKHDLDALMAEWRASQAYKADFPRRKSFSRVPR